MRPLVLLYHSISRAWADPWGLRVSPRNFAHHMAVLRDLAEPVGVDALDDETSSGRSTKRRVVVTFDDGYADNFHTALPILERHNIPATFFISTGYIGNDREYWWDELDRIFLRVGQLPELFTLKVGKETASFNLKNARNYGVRSLWRNRRTRNWNKAQMSPRHKILEAVKNELLACTVSKREQALDQLRTWAGETPRVRPTHATMNLEQLRALADSPLVTIGAHTVMHPQLDSLDAPSQRHEIAESKRWLEESLQKPIETFSYPFGSPDDYNDESVRIVQEEGYESAFSVQPSGRSGAFDRFRIPRAVVSDCDADEFAELVGKHAAES